MTDAINQIASKHINLSHQYGCRAYMTVVTFVFAGIAHRARRFFRADMPQSGRTEIYTIESYPGVWTSMTEFGWYESVAREDFLGYVAAVPTSRRDRMVTMLVEAATSGGADAFAERIGQLEVA